MKQEQIREMTLTATQEMGLEWMQGAVVGTGNTATVYEWGQDKVLKLFHEGYPREAVEKEFLNAKAIHDLDFAKPKAYQIVTRNARMGIVYDKLRGESLQEWVIRTRDVYGCAEYMSRLHQRILINRAADVPSYKEFLRYCIGSAFADDPKKREDGLRLLAQLEEGDVLCHGDFHPGNILISEGNAMVLDFMNVCHGPALYDVARTVYLVQYTPVPPIAEDREVLLQFKKLLADLYLLQMRVTRDMIQDYLAVILMARVGECPDENDHGM